jgi:hypothetical protein
VSKVLWVVVAVGLLVVVMLDVQVPSKKTGIKKSISSSSISFPFKDSEDPQNARVNNTMKKWKAGLITEKEALKQLDDTAEYYYKAAHSKLPRAN